MSLENKIVTMAETIGADVRELKSGKVDKVSGKGLSDTNFTQIEKTKLAGVAAAATKNRADSENANKVHTHTTAQITGLDTALAGKASTSDSRFTNAREWSAATVTQAEVEAGTSTTRRAFTAQRVRQAIVAWFNGISGALGRTILTRTTAAQVRADIGLGTAATMDVVQESGTSSEAVMSQEAVTSQLTTKVDKVTGKVLSDTNFTQVEKTKLAGVANGATANRSDSLNADKAHTHTTTQVVGLDTALASKVDKVAGKGLSDTNFTQVEKTKLSGVAVGATKNATDAQLRDRATHTGEQPISSVKSLQSTLDSKVDKIAGKGLSTSDFTPAEKAKLASLESSKYRGNYSSLAALQAANPSPSAGEYADVDSGVGKDTTRWIWDNTDSAWIDLGAAPALTSTQVKVLYEENGNTNAYTDAEKTKLSGVATGATKNRSDSANADKIHKHVTADVTGLDAVLLTKFDKADIEQELGFATDKVMSQKAVSEAIAAIPSGSTINVVQEKGNSTTNVMSQKAVTDTFKECFPFDIPENENEALYGQMNLPTWEFWEDGDDYGYTPSVAYAFVDMVDYPYPYIALRSAEGTLKVADAVEDKDAVNLAQMNAAIASVEGGGSGITVVQKDGLSASAVMSQYAVSIALYEIGTLANRSYLYCLEQHAALHALDPETATLPQLIRALQSATFLDYEEYLPPPEP